MRLPRGLLKRLIREGRSAPEAMKAAWRMVREAGELPRRRPRRNPGARWHGKEATRAEAARWSSEQSGRLLGAHYYRGKREAHRESQDESRRIGLNPRVTPKQIKQAVQALRNSTGIPLVVEWAYGKPRVYVEEGTGVRELSPRLSTGELWLWLQGFQEGIERQQRKKNPGAAWHEEMEWHAEQLAKAEKREGQSGRYYEGQADAHRLSAHESRKLGLNPRRPSRARYVHERLEPKGRFDPRSFRTVQSGEALVTVGCPKGQWDAKRRRCRVGTRAQRIMRPKGSNPLTRKEAGSIIRAALSASRSARKGGRSPRRGTDSARDYFMGRRDALVDVAYGFGPQRMKRVRRVGKFAARRNPIAVYNPPPGRLIYGRVLGVEAQKTNGTYRGKRFRHSFERDSRVAAYAMPDGSVLLKSAAGKRLWQDR